MSLVPDFEFLNRDRPGDRTPKRVLPEGEAFVQYRATDREPAPALELSDILDVQPIQSLMNDFYEICHIPMGLIDINGKVLAGVGWQSICTDFHRVHPESCRNCVESDTEITAGIRPGEYRRYKCKNNLWDVATPLMLGEHHVGNIFSGQFFFDDEQPDRDFFRQQARHYGFDEQRYLAALDTVPRLSRETVDRGMTFLTKLAHIVSELSFSNFKMAQWVTQRKQSEEALIRSEKLASVGRLAATVAHEINNPLEAATNCVYLLKSNTDLTPELREYLEVAERELQRVALITRQTLGFYRENTKPAQVNLPDLVDEVAALYSPKLKAKDLSLRLEYRGESVSILAVAGEVRQVISNLLTNAIDASSKNGTLLVRTSSLLLNGRTYVRVTVADEGSGIAPDDLPHLFKPFFTTKEQYGTGLGLWVSQQIAGKHHGRIRVRSAEGQGTVFSVLLPQSEAPQSQANAAAAS